MMGGCLGYYKDQEKEKVLSQMLCALGKHKRKGMEDPQCQSEAGTVAGLMAKALDFSLNQVLAGTFTEGSCLSYETSSVDITKQKTQNPG